MKIEYLKSLEQNIVTMKNTLERKGYTMVEIEGLEMQLNNGEAFPKSFREYLFLAGRRNNVSLSIGAFTDEPEKFTGVKEYFEEEIVKRGLSMNRPYVIFHNKDGESFSLIHLDEGDDPMPYHFELYEESPKEPFEYTNVKSFSELIDYLVDSGLKGLQPW